MTTIEAYRQKGIPCGIKVLGHTGYATSGTDIVCAAISVLVQTLEIGLGDVAGLQVKSVVDAASAFIELHWGIENSERVSILTEAIFKALEEISRSYSNNVKFVEVSL